MSKKINRKEFLKKTAAVGMGAMLFPKVKINTPIKKDTVRLGFIGTGLRGQWLLDLASKRDDVIIPAICDIDQHMIDRTLRILKRKLQRDGFFKIIKLKNTYEKPSEKKKRILQENIKRVKKLNKLKNRI